jgi:hypothetical protein
LNENSYKFGATIKNMKGFFIILFTLTGISCSGLAYTDTLKTVCLDDEFGYHTPEIRRICMIDSLIDVAHQHTGTPYKYAGCSPSGFDCSGFMNYIHRFFGVELLRSSREIAKTGETIAFKDIQPGDLVFFKGRKTSSTAVGHVGLVIEKTPNSFKMIHASVSHGVRVDDYETPYYKQRFLFAKRIAYPANAAAESENMEAID